MSTSGSTDFTQTRDQIIADALAILGVYGAGDTVSSNDTSFCSNILNKMVKGWEGMGIHLWKEKEAALFLTLDQQRYSLLSSSSDRAGINPIFTSVDIDSSGTSVTVDSSTGMAVSDNIGIVMDNDTIHWTTITAITGDTLTINSALTDTASAGNNVFVFTTRVDKPLHITAARFRNADGTERPLMLDGRKKFMNMPNKDMTGKANLAYFSPQLSDMLFYVWPVADDVNDCITFSYIARIEDFDSASDNADLPQEWLETITYNLALRVAPAFGVDLRKKSPDVEMMAVQSLEQMKLWDAEEASLHVVPNERFD